MPSPQRVRGNGCLFSNSPALCLAVATAATAAVKPLACCLPGKQRGSLPPRASPAPAGARRMAEGKESAQPNWGSLLSLHRADTPGLAVFPTRKRLSHTLSRPKSLLGTWAEAVPTASPLPALPADLPVPSERAAGAHPWASGSGSSGLRGGSARGAARRAAGWRVPWLVCTRRVPLRLCAPHLSSVTCRLRHQMSVLR